MNSCDTKYPLLMLHGMGFRDRKYLNYWGRIPKTLKKHGAKIFYGHQDSSATIEANAEMVKKSLEKILADTGCEKVNIIAHSKGGLEARYLASTLGMSEHIASISTINTPHNGSITVDKLLTFPDFMVKFVGFCTDTCMKILGDSKPDAYTVFYQFTTKKASDFNTQNPDADGVFYQSFGFKMKNIFSDLAFTIPYLIVKKFDGDNDGLLSEKSVTWTTFHGMYTSSSNRGISHADQVDIRRRRLTKKPAANDHKFSDITNFYQKLVSDLKNKGL